MLLLLYSFFSLLSLLCITVFFFFNNPPPPRFTRTDYLFPCTTLFRSHASPRSPRPSQRPAGRRARTTPRRRDRAGQTRSGREADERQRLSGLQNGRAHV